MSVTMSPNRLLVTITWYWPGILDQEHRQRVDVLMRRRDAGILRRDFLEDALPQRMALLHGVALVGHAHLGVAVRLRELERVADDAIHALVGVDLFLDRNLVVGAGLEAAADADVHAFGVLAEHDEVDVLAAAILERAEAIVEQPDRAGS